MEGQRKWFEVIHRDMNERDRGGKKSEVRKGSGWRSRRGSSVDGDFGVESSLKRERLGVALGYLT